MENMIADIVYELRCDTSGKWFLYHTEVGLPWRVVAVLDDEDDARFAQKVFQGNRRLYHPEEQPQ